MLRRGGYISSFRSRPEGKGRDLFMKRCRDCWYLARGWVFHMRTLEDVMRDLGFDLKLSKKGVSVDLSIFLNLKS